MKKMQIFFIVLVLGLMILPWFNIEQSQISGVEKTAPLPSFSWRTYKDGTFQKRFNAWWNGNFGSRNNMLIIKNDIYEVLNLGLFHAGYSGNILQGKQGVLYERNYLSSKFFPYSVDYAQKNATETVMLLARLRDRLSGMGKHLLFIMAPSKADARDDALPHLWQFLADNISEPPGIYPLWEKELARAHIIHVNAFEVLKQKDILKDSFPDTGTHWSMLAAGLTLEEGIKRLNDAGAALPAVQIKGERISDEDHAAERDIADLLNIRPRYHKGRSTWKLATYQPIPVKQSIHTISIGDSFSNQIHRNILQSGFSTFESVAQFENRMPGREEWFRLLNAADILVLTYTYPALKGPRIKEEVSTLLGYTDDLILENWHSYEEGSKGQWSKQKSSVAFFHDAEKDSLFSFELKNTFHATALHLSINGRELRRVDLNALSLPAKITLPIPRQIMRKGRNSLDFFVDGASTPLVVLDNNMDVRTIGVFCSDFSIAR